VNEQTLTALSAEVARIARELGWEVAIVTDGRDVVGITIAHPTDMRDLVPYGFDSQIMTPRETSHDQ
jgi:hypothetical protein